MSYNSTGKKWEKRDSRKKTESGYKPKNFKGEREISTIKGVVMGTSQGYAFVRSSEIPEDVMIQERDLNFAVHSDTVLVRITSRRKSGNGKGQRLQGEIIKIVERGVKTIVGTVSITTAGVLVIPDDVRFAESVFIQRQNAMNAPTGFKVVVEITDYPSRTTMAQGKIIEILGDAKSFKVSTLSVVRSFGLIEEFPESVIAEAKKVAVLPTSKDFEHRRDLRHKQIITIDGEDARDFDDAISIEKTKSGNFLLGVHIADVANYVKAGSLLDGEAFRRGTSVYFPDMVLPMLPVELSNDVCSLNENTDKLTLSVDIEVDKQGKICNYDIYESVMRSAKRMTYTLVTKILENDAETTSKYKELVPMCKMMEELAHILIDRRNAEGNLDFDLPETYFKLDENYEVLDVLKKERGISDRIIEQFMILANEIVAKHVSKLQLPFVYRVHGNPTPEKMRAFVDFISAFHVSLNVDVNNVQPKDLQALLLKIKDEEYSPMVSMVMLRSMQKAIYSPDNLGHFGLALKDYCHFTAPIRRYSDVFVHRMLKLMIHNQISASTIKNFEALAVSASEQASVTERKADEAERAVDDLKKTEYMVKHIGEVYEARISGVVEAGIFVALENTIEGMILKEYLPDDHYQFDEKRFAIIGKKNSFKLGDKITVKAESVDLLLRRINFVPANTENMQKIGK
ncbi:MAG: ribonuclease R [Clostridia bacterium]